MSTPLQNNSSADVVNLPLAEPGVVVKKKKNRKSCQRALAKRKRLLLLGVIDQSNMPQNNAITVDPNKVNTTSNTAQNNSGVATNIKTTGTGQQVKNTSTNNVTKSVNQSAIVTPTKNMGGKLRPLMPNQFGRFPRPRFGPFPRPGFGFFPPFGPNFFGRPRLFNNKPWKTGKNKKGKQNISKLNSNFVPPSSSSQATPPSGIGGLQNFDVICHNAQVETEELTKRKLQVLILSNRERGLVYFEEQERIQHYLGSQMFTTMSATGTRRPKLHFSNGTFVEPGWFSVVAQNEVSYEWLLSGWPWLVMNDATFRPVKAIEVNKIGVTLATPCVDIAMLLSILLVQNRKLKVKTWIHLGVLGQPRDWTIVFIVTSEIADLLKTQGWHVFYELGRLAVKLMPLSDLV